MESHRRSILKAVTWRIFALAITTGTTWILTGEMSLAVSVGLADMALKIGSFYVHERAWNRSKFGLIQSANNLSKEDSQRADKLDFRKPQGACGQP